MKILETIHKSIIIYMHQASVVSSFKLLYKKGIYNICNSTCDLMHINLMRSNDVFYSSWKTGMNSYLTLVENLKSYEKNEEST